MYTFILKKKIYLIKKITVDNLTVALKREEREKGKINKHCSVGGCLIYQKYPYQLQNKTRTALYFPFVLQIINWCSPFNNCIMWFILFFYIYKFIFIYLFFYHVHSILSLNGKTGRAKINSRISDICCNYYLV